MGHQIGRRKRPRRGSLQFWPRSRAKRAHPSISSWPESSEAKLLGFAGYKAGMAHVIIVDNRKTSRTKGEEISAPVTIIETPPLKFLGVRLYKKTSEGLQVLFELRNDELNKELARKIKLSSKKELAKKMKKAEEVLDNACEVRMIAYTQPKLASIGKKKPEVFEIKLGGGVKEAFEHAKELLNKEVKISEIFSEGDYVDSFSVSKGKGFQGSVKRFGVRILQHKAEKVKRKAGTLGPWTPKKVTFRAPQHGQMGYHSRAEYNKQVMKVGNKLDVKGGLVNYGNVTNDYVLLAGSIPGAKKRLILLRKAFRQSKGKRHGAQEVAKVMTGSQQ